MRQAENSGDTFAVVRQRVSSQEVLTNNRLRLVGVKLRDWLGCFDCRTQQVEHAYNGDAIPERCWRCDSTNIGYMDEVARANRDDLYRLVRR